MPQRICSGFHGAFAFVTVAVVLTAASSAAAQGPTPRQVAAPASDIASGIVRLPDPAAAPTVSYAAILPVKLERVPGAGWVAELTYPVERAGTLVLALLSPAAANWKLLAGPVGSRLLPIDEFQSLERRTGFAGDEMPGWIIDRRDVHGVAAGMWKVRIEASEPSALADGWLLASASGDVRAEAYVTTQMLVAGSPIGIAARARGPEVFGVERAQVVLETDSNTRKLAMLDDGAHEDGAAGDGLFGALVPEDMLGQVRASVELSGTTRAGNAFLRSTLVAFPVLEPRLILDGSAAATLVDDAHLRIAIGAVPLAPEQRLHVSTEVWGRNSVGEFVPVCWLSKMLDPEVRVGSWQLPLALDLDWLDVAGASAPLQLRAVRVQDPDAEGVYAMADAIECSTPRLRAAVAAGARAITPKMLTGDSATTIGMPAPPPPEYPFKRTLMLVHGYCSSGSIWPAADFSQPKLEFLDPNANRTHDQFAQLIAQRAVSATYASFGVVAHSQGGPASLHLLTYYTSGLDLSFGGRRIQSLASPYQGTPLASLGNFACGVNNDMTPAGSATWLAGIPTWARAEVYYWTTSNTGSACNFFTNLLLTDPEDGTVEMFRGQLPGANNMGHVTGWCHTTGMSNPASYTDHVRNQAMNAAASR